MVVVSEEAARRLGQGGSDRQAAVRRRACGSSARIAYRREPRAVETSLEVIGVAAVPASDGFAGAASVTPSPTRDDQEREDRRTVDRVGARSLVPPIRRLSRGDPFAVLEDIATLRSTMIGAARDGAVAYGGEVCGRCRAAAGVVGSTHIACSVHSARARWRRLAVGATPGDCRAALFRHGRRVTGSPRHRLPVDDCGIRVVKRLIGFKAGTLVSGVW